jgi:hypothetical protein
VAAAGALGALVAGKRPGIVVVAQQIEEALRQQLGLQPLQRRLVVAVADIDRVLDDAADRVGDPRPGTAQISRAAR